MSIAALLAAGVESLAVSLLWSFQNPTHEQRLREIARDPAGLGSVLDYLLGWEPLLLEFAEAHEFNPESVAAARRKLPGGENIYDPS